MGSGLPTLSATSGNAGSLLTCLTVTILMKAVNTELLSLLNPQSSEGEGGCGHIGLLIPSMLIAWSQPLCGLQEQWLMIKTGISRVLLSGDNDLDWWNLNCWGVNSMGAWVTLALSPAIWCSVMAWAIAHLTFLYGQRVNGKICWAYQPRCLVL